MPFSREKAPERHFRAEERARKKAALEIAPRKEHVHVLESPDPVHLSAVLGKLNPKRTAVNVVSK